MNFIYIFFLLLFDSIYIYMKWELVLYDLYNFMYFLFVEFFFIYIENKKLVFVIIICVVIVFLLLVGYLNVDIFFRLVWVFYLIY